MISRNIIVTSMRFPHGEQGKCYFLVVAFFGYLHIYFLGPTIFNGGHIVSLLSERPSRPSVPYVTQMVSV